MLVLRPPGLEIAERMYERHKLPTELLIGLGVSPETARDDACKMNMISARKVLLPFANTQSNIAEDEYDPPIKCFIII